MMITTSLTGVNRHALALFYAIARQLRIVDGPGEVHLRSIARHELRAQASPPAAAAAIRGDTLMAPAN